MKTRLLILALAAVTLLTGCEDKKGEEGGAKNGWIKYRGKTYDLTVAASNNKIDVFPGSPAKGFNIRIANSDLSNDLIFAFYSDAATLREATGTYTKATGTPTPGTMSNFKTSPLVDREHVYGEVVDEQLKIGYSDGKYIIEGYFRFADGTLEFYYKGDVQIQ